MATCWCYQFVLLPNIIKKNRWQNYISICCIRNSLCQVKPFLIAVHSYRGKFWRIGASDCLRNPGCSWALTLTPWLRSFFPVPGHHRLLKGPAALPDWWWITSSHLRVTITKKQGGFFYAFKMCRRNILLWKYRVRWDQQQSQFTEKTEQFLVSQSKEEVGTDSFMQECWF